MSRNKINWNTSDGEDRAEETGFDARLSTAKRALYAKTADQCRVDIMAAIRAGDHDQAWDLIFDGPDATRAGHRIEGKNPNRERNIVFYRLSVTERVSMSDELAAFARQNGWDEAVSRATRERRIRQRSGAVKGVARDLVAPDATGLTRRIAAETRSNAAKHETGGDGQ